MGQETHSRFAERKELRKMFADERPFIPLTPRLPTPLLESGLSVSPFPPTDGRGIAPSSLKMYVRRGTRVEGSGSSFHPPSGPCSKGSSLPSSVSKFCLFSFCFGHQLLSASHAWVQVRFESEKEFFSLYRGGAHLAGYVGVVVNILRSEGCVFHTNIDSGTFLKERREIPWLTLFID
jgi:hypothetical protein